MRFKILLLLILTAFAMPVLANQIGITFTEDSIGGLADYEKKVLGGDFAADVQVQKSDTVSLIMNGSIQGNINETVGIQPFISYNKDEFGNIIDVGGVLNFSVGALDISAGASFRGANPVADNGIDGFDADGNSIKYFTEDPSNFYSVPDVNNVNGVFKTDFEKWGVETGLTLYAPITQRDVVPVVIISRSQTSIEFGNGLEFSLVLDGRTYLHKNGLEISLMPQGGFTYRFR